MRFKKMLLLVTVAAVSCRALAADTNSPALAWRALTNSTLSPPPAGWSVKPPTEADVLRFDDQRAAEAGAIADKAHDFYTTFPKDPYAPYGRVIEIGMLQTSVHLGATN